MNRKTTKQSFPMIWEHPDLGGAVVAAFTKEVAYNLVKESTGKDLDVTKFRKTGELGWSQRVLSTPDELFLFVLPQRNSQED